MTIVSGTDLSEKAAQASLAAAAIARRLGLPLKLIHVADELFAERAAAGGQGGIYDSVRQKVRDQAIEIGKRFGIGVEPVVVAGSPTKSWLRLPPLFRRG